MIYYVKQFALHLFGGENKMFEKNLEIGYLLDFYGDVLPDRYQSILDLYYNDDLSLAEIAENAGISRQGVRDVIVRAEATMQEVEDKTGIIKRFEAQRPHLEAIEAAAAEIQTINYRQYEDPRLSELTELITNKIAALKE